MPTEPLESDLTKSDIAIAFTMRHSQSNFLFCFLRKKKKKFRCHSRVTTQKMWSGPFKFGLQLPRGLIIFAADENLFDQHHLTRLLHPWPVCILVWQPSIKFERWKNWKIKKKEKRLSKNYNRARSVYVVFYDGLIEIEISKWKRICLSLYAATCRNFLISDQKSKTSPVAAGLSVPIISLDTTRLASSSLTSLHLFSTHL